MSTPPITATAYRFVGGPYHNRILNGASRERLAAILTDLAGATYSLRCSATGVDYQPEIFTTRHGTTYVEFVASTYHLTKQPPSTPLSIRLSQF